MQLDYIFSPQFKEEDFESTALRVFEYQAVHCLVYKTFIEHLGIKKEQVNSISDIPFLPVSFFKTHEVTSAQNCEKVFSSSGTTGSIQSKHYVADLSIYEAAFITGFERQYGPIADYVVLALLPSYLEREGSSLIYMANAMINKSQHSESGFFLYNHKDLFEVLNKVQLQGKKTLLIGVSFALVDFAEQYQLDLGETVVMETGGMKGRRKELIRPELHQILKEALGLSQIHSEYGMTELLSQAYAKEEGLFETPPWMKILIRDPLNPMGYLSQNKSGGINIIDLANWHSCSFIATQDLGKQHTDGRFEVLGRFDHSDIRGCSLLVN